MYSAAFHVHRFNINFILPTPGRPGGSLDVLV